MDEMEYSVIILTPDPVKAQDEVVELFGDLDNFKLICVTPYPNGYEVYFSYTFIHNIQS